MKSRLIKKAVFLIIAGIIASSAGCSSGQAGSTSQTDTGWRLEWGDEFDGPDGEKPDSGKWSAELGNNSGWGNAELEYYTDSTANCSQQGGSLVIRAEKENKEGFGYTSARIKTKGKFEFQYGRIEMKARLPEGNGIWPAFWLLGSDIDTVRWPACGEVDIMEYIGRKPQSIYGTLHGPEYNGSMGIQGTVASSADLHKEFHTYALEWDKDSLSWYFDGELYHKVLRANLLKGYTWVFDKKFFIILNLAVGGNWPKNPDDTTVFPQEYIIDYVRVYQR